MSLNNAKIFDESTSQRLPGVAAVMPPTSIEPLSHTLELFLDGTPAPSILSSSIRRIAIDESLNLPARLRMTVHDPSEDWQRSVLEVIGSDAIRHALRIDLFPQGRGRDDGEASLFSGSLTRIEAEMGADSALTLDLVAHDPLRRLSQTYRHRAHAESTDVELVRTLALEHGLEFHADDEGFPTTYLVQDGGDDLSFLQQVCQRTGRDFVVREGTLHLLSLHTARGTPVLLEWGKGLERVAVEVERMGGPERVVLRDRDVLAAETVEVGVTSSKFTRRSDVTSAAEASTSFESGSGVIDEDAVRGSAETLEVEAAARLEAGRRRRERFEGLARGSSHLRAGALVQVIEAGEGMDGKWRLSSVEHRLGAERGWTVTMVGFRAEVG